MRVQWVLLLLASCGSVDSKSSDASLSDALLGDASLSDVALADAPLDTVPDPEVAPASCFALHTERPSLPSGTYTIDPDGVGGDDPISVHCDMMTDGGGWTIVFFAPSDAFDSLPIAYTSGNSRLMADAQHVLIAYRSATQVAYANYARFDLPAGWRTETPFGDLAADLRIGVSVNGSPLVTATLRYGRATFATMCNDEWNTTTVWGRVCIIGTMAPHYNGFVRAGVDFCSDSSEAYNTSLCTSDKRFSIAVR